MNPTPRTPEAHDIKPITLEVIAQMRDGDMSLCGNARVKFTYDPSDPYALSLEIADIWGYQEPRTWTASREVFAAAALWGIDLPGLDLSVQTVVVTRATPGQPVRDVPCMRVTLREVDSDERGRYFTRSSMFMDIVTAETIRYFQTITDVVRVGHEHKHIDIDAAIAEILSQNY